jgi:hypothetical protein
MVAPLPLVEMDRLDLHKPWDCEGSGIVPAIRCVASLFSCSRHQSAVQRADRGQSPSTFNVCIPPSELSESGLPRQEPTIKLRQCNVSPKQPFRFNIRVEGKINLLQSASEIGGRPAAARQRNQFHKPTKQPEAERTLQLSGGGLKRNLPSSGNGTPTVSPI